MAEYFRNISPCQSGSFWDFATMYTLLSKLCNFIAYQKELVCILFLSLPLEKFLTFQGDLLLKEDKLYPIPTNHFLFFSGKAVCITPKCMSLIYLQIKLLEFNNISTEQSKYISYMHFLFRALKHNKLQWLWFSTLIFILTVFNTRWDTNPTKQNPLNI